MDRSRIVVMEDLCRILCETPGVQRTLERIVQHVAQKMGADVCSVYALNEEKEYLTLQATVGLSKESVGRVGMSVHEGLVGLVLEKQEPVFVIHPEKHPRYKFFEESGEERFQTFMGIPLAYQHEVLGALVIQTIREDALPEADIAVLSTVASQVATILGYTGLLEDLKTEPEVQGCVFLPCGCASRNSSRNRPKNHGSPARRRSNRPRFPGS